MKKELKNCFPSEFIQNLSFSLIGGTKPECSITNPAAHLWHVCLSYTLDEPCRQDECSATLTAGFHPDFTWAAHLTPEEGFIAAQHIFRTPAVIFRNKTNTMILIPDISVTDHQAVPCYLDMDALNQEITIGLSRSQVHGHILYQKAPGAVFPVGETKLAFYLLLYPESLSNPFRPVLNFYWNHYGKKDFLRFSASHQDLLPYVKHTYRWAFDNWFDTVWQEFEENGIPVGAPAFIVTASQSPNYTDTPHQREALSIWNQAWFCSLRSASGLYRYARRTKNRRLLDYANKTKELALAFPQKDGLFPGVIATEMESFFDGTQQNMRSLGWKTRFWGNSDRNPFSQDIKTSPYHLLDMSFTAEYMLLWYEELEKDERLLEYALRYADRLIRLQDDNGFFPGWTDADGTPLGVLDNSPESSMSAAFLFHCYRMTGKELYLSSALRALNAVSKEIIPSGRWEDFETYWSCSHFWNDKVGSKIPRNNMYKQCNFSMYFTALAFLEAYKTTNDHIYLASGTRVLDELLMTQSSYQPSAFTVPVIGGFGVLNSDAELNDARQSLFSVLILQYGKFLNNEEYIQRGLAALRISFSMMYCPENPEAKIQWEKAWPFFNEKDYGFNMENYGHNGEITNEGVGIGEFTIYDWGNGAASEAYLRLLDLFGADFVNQTIK